MPRRRGPSVRLRLTLSYAGFLLVAGAALLAVVWRFLLHYVPAEAVDYPAWTPGRADLERVFVPAAALAMAGLLVLGLVGGWILAGRILAPLNRITAATRAAADGALSYRIRLEGRRDEFRDLADDFDAMLERLESHVAEQQRFAANASHELRTPLAITRTLLDVARRNPGEAGEELLDRLHAVNDRAVRLTEAMLLLSRADSRSFEREDVDLSLLAEAAAEALLPLAEQRGFRLEVSGQVAWATGSPALLLQMITNLVQNAILHNRADGGWVTVRTSSGTGSTSLLVVENPGAPLTPAFLETATERFRRGHDRVHGHDTGVGLGLAIVRSIVDAHGGGLHLRPRAGGGLRAEVRLPGADPSRSSRVRPGVPGTS